MDAFRGKSKSKNTFYGSSTHGVFQLGPCFYGLSISRDQVRSHVEQAVAMGVDNVCNVSAGCTATAFVTALLSNHR